MDVKPKIKYTLNEGFGPQLKGDKTIAQLFDDEFSVHLTQQDREDRVIVNALDPALLSEIRKFKTKLTRNTPVHKYELLIMWLEHKVTESTLKQ